MIAVGIIGVVLPCDVPTLLFTRVPPTHVLDTSWPRGEVDRRVRRLERPACVAIDSLDPAQQKVVPVAFVV